VAASPKLTQFLAQSNKLAARMRERKVAPSPELARAGMAQFANFVTDIPEIAHLEDRRIVGGGVHIPVRIYSPAPQQKLPVFMYYHGGGHMCGSVNLYDPMTRKMALAAKVIVVSVDYRLAPEHPYPAGLTDCYHATKNVWRILDNINYEQRLFIGGDSAGGALAASIVMQNQESRRLDIEKQVLIYPGLDYTMSCDSYKTRGSGYLLETDKIKFYFDCYFQQNEDRRNVSPLFGPFSKYMPQTLVLTAGFDPLKDEGRIYYEKIRQHGGLAKHYEFVQMIHAFMNLESLVQAEVQELYQRIAAFLNA
jgi:acetyl esterase